MEVLAARVLRSTPDLDAALRFYEDGLGLTRFREWGRRPHRGIVYFLGGAYLELTEAAPAAAPPPPQGVRLWLQVPDAGAARELLVSRDITIAAEPERKPWGLIELSVHDPDGFELVLVEVPADHPLRRDTRSSS